MSKSMLRSMDGGVSGSHGVPVHDGKGHNLRTVDASGHYGAENETHGCEVRMGEVRKLRL
jgi:hypothetical protein